MLRVEETVGSVADPVSEGNGCQWESALLALRTASYLQWDEWVTKLGNCSGPPLIDTMGMLSAQSRDA